jgi:hypothetical protein
MSTIWAIRIGGTCTRQSVVIEGDNNAIIVNGRTVAPGFYEHCTGGLSVPTWPFILAFVLIIIAIVCCCYRHHRQANQAKLIIYNQEEKTNNYV